METIPSRDLFGTDNPVELAARTDEFRASLESALVKGINGETVVNVPGLPSTPASALAMLEKAASDPGLSKSMSADVLTSLNAAVSTARSAQADLVKDLTLTSPLSTGYVPFDLEAPAKLLTPRPTPLRNKLPRKKGLGTSHRYKRITGITGSGTGGVGNLHPGISDGTQTSFAPSGAANSLYYARGPKVSYAGDEFSVPYFQYSLSDQVPWSAQYSGQGFQDIRALSTQTVLYSSMLMEERMLLMGRGSNASFLGALAAPTITSLTARAPGAGEVGITGATTDLYVKVSADAGDFGASVLSGASTVAVTNGQVVDVVVALPVGAVGQRVYVSTGASDPGDASRWYDGRSGYTTFTIQGALPTSGVAASTVTADSSAYANGYDGILPIVLGPNSGKVNTINSAFSSSNPGTEFQTVFASLYQSVKADPDEMLFNGNDRKQLSDLLKTASSSNYRLTVRQDEIGGVTLGDVVTAIQNEVTGKVVPMTVHPWMPQGNVPVLSYSLPIPDTSVSDVWSVFNVQDYLGVQWPVNQFAYEMSSYWYGTFLCYAPAWNGAVTGIKLV